MAIRRRSPLRANRPSPNGTCWRKIDFSTVPARCSASSRRSAFDRRTKRKRKMHSASSAPPCMPPGPFCAAARLPLSRRHGAQRPKPPCANRPSPGPPGPARLRLPSRFCSRKRHAAAEMPRIKARGAPGNAQSAFKSSARMPFPTCKGKQRKKGCLPFFLAPCFPACFRGAKSLWQFAAFAVPQAAYLPAAPFAAAILLPPVPRFAAARTVRTFPAGGRTRSAGIRSAR